VPELGLALVPELGLALALALVPALGLALALGSALVPALGSALVPVPALVNQNLHHHMRINSRLPLGITKVLILVYFSFFLHSFNFHHNFMLIQGY
jgi:hypothetical protein